MTKLNRYQVNQIIDAKLGGMKVTEIALNWGICRRYVYKILRQEARVPFILPEEALKLTSNDIRLMKVHYRKCILEGWGKESLRRLAQKYKLTPTKILKIIGEY